MSDPQQTAPTLREEELIAGFAAIQHDLQTAPARFKEEQQRAELDQRLMQRLARRDRRAKIRELLQDQQRLDKQREDVREELEALQLEEEDDEELLRISVSRLEAKFRELSDRFDKEKEQRQAKD